ncbi:MAG: hypothetical protein ABL966_10975, partial [Acidimicrobiales bacterium]
AASATSIQSRYTTTSGNGIGSGVVDQVQGLHHFVCYTDGSTHLSTGIRLGIDGVECTYQSGSPGSDANSGHVPVACNGGVSLGYRNRTASAGPTYAPDRGQPGGFDDYALWVGAAGGATIPTFAQLLAIYDNAEAILTLTPATLAFMARLRTSLTPETGGTVAQVGTCAYQNCRTLELPAMRRGNLALAARFDRTVYTDTACTTPATTKGQVVKGVLDDSGNQNTLTEATNGPLFVPAEGQYPQGILLHSTSTTRSMTGGTPRQLAKATLNCTFNDANFTMILVGRVQNPSGAGANATYARQVLVSCPGFEFTIGLNNNTGLLGYKDGSGSGEAAGVYPSSSRCIMVLRGKNATTVTVQVDGGTPVDIARTSLSTARSQLTLGTDQAAAIRTIVTAEAIFLCNRKWSDTEVTNARLALCTEFGLPTAEPDVLISGDGSSSGFGSEDLYDEVLSRIRLATPSKRYNRFRGGDDIGGGADSMISYTLQVAPVDGVLSGFAGRRKIMIVQGISNDLANAVGAWTLGAGYYQASGNQIGVRFAYSGADVYRCILANGTEDDATAEPGVGATWQTYWALSSEEEIAEYIVNNNLQTYCAARRAAGYTEVYVLATLDRETTATSVTQERMWRRMIAANNRCRTIPSPAFTFVSTDLHPILGGIGKTYTAIPVSGGAGTFTYNETVTETGSGATAVFRGEVNGVIYLRPVSGTLLGARTLTGGTSGATRTGGTIASVLDTVYRSTDRVHIMPPAHLIVNTLLEAAMAGDGLLSGAARGRPLRNFERLRA